MRVEESAWDAWRTHLQTQPVQHWTAEELARVFVEKGGVRYSHSHWSHLLREREGMYFYKPRPRDYRRSEDAPEQLADRIEATFDALQAMGYDLERVGGLPMRQPLNCTAITATAGRPASGLLSPA